MIKLPTPHYDKLIVCLNNDRLPKNDHPKIEEVINKYYQWIKDLESVSKGDSDVSVQRVRQLKGLTYLKN